MILVSMIAARKYRHLIENFIVQVSTHQFHEGVPAIKIAYLLS
jgi:hypothetical protein